VWKRIRMWVVPSLVMCMTRWGRTRFNKVYRMLLMGIRWMFEVYFVFIYFYWPVYLLLFLLFYLSNTFDILIVLCAWGTQFKRPLKPRLPSFFASLRRFNLHVIRLTFAFPPTVCYAEAWAYAGRPHLSLSDCVPFAQRL
jgi:hypothetical protein